VSDPLVTFATEIVLIKTFKFWITSNLQANQEQFYNLILLSYWKMCISIPAWFSCLSNSLNTRHKIISKLHTVDLTGVIDLSVKAFHRLAVSPLLLLCCHNTTRQYWSPAAATCTKLQ